MFGSDWARQFGSSGLFVFFIVSCFAILLHIGADHEQANEGAQPQKTTRHSSVSIGHARDEARPGEFQPDCSKSEDAHLCTQRRLVEAAEWQVLATWIGTFLVVCTLTLMVCANRAAVLAVAKAEEMNAITKAAQRAWIDLSVIVEKIIVHPNHIRVVTDWKVTNIGKTVAEDVREHFRNIPSAIRTQEIKANTFAFHDQQIAAATTNDVFGSTALPSKPLGSAGQISTFNMAIGNIKQNDSVAVPFAYCVTYRSSGLAGWKLTGGCLMVIISGPFTQPENGQVELVTPQVKSAAIDMCSRII